MPATAEKCPEQTPVAADQKISEPVRKSRMAYSKSVISSGLRHGKNCPCAASFITIKFPGGNRCMRNMSW